MLGALFLFPVALLLNWIKQKNTAPEAEDRGTGKEAFLTKPTLIGDAACGLALFLAASFQQNGLIYTASGKAGFITGLYIVMSIHYWVCYYARRCAT
ncbi:MAG: hypothetical protein RQM92_11785 [Candidatus Syntrophopropionicum ammoniitolerans]